MYKDVRKKVFVDRYKQFDLVEDCINFLRKIEELKPYMIEFHEYDILKPKVYLSEYIINSEEHWPIIMITHNKCILSVKNDMQKISTNEGNTFLQPKIHDKKIMFRILFSLLGVLIWLFDPRIKRRSHRKNRVNLYGGSRDFQI